MSKRYNELAVWWPLVSNPAEYIEEVAFFLPLLAEFVIDPFDHHVFVARKP